MHLETDAKSREQEPPGPFPSYESIGRHIKCRTNSYPTTSYSRTTWGISDVASAYHVYIDAPLYVTCSTMLLHPTSLLCRRAPQLAFSIPNFTASPIRKALLQKKATGIRFTTHNTFRRMAFERLIRFEGADGQVHWGDFGTDEVKRDNFSGRKVEILSGSIESGFKKSGQQGQIAKLLAPLEKTPVFLCVGLNYKQHAEEGGIAIPTYPTIFMKPPTALAGPGADVHVHKDCQSQLDYEGELTIVIGKTGKNIAAADYADYVLGYTVGNDVSARNFQLPASVSGGQFGYAKSFDGFAPVGPCIASQSAIGGDPNKIRYWTKVNGEKRQETGTDDMIWSVGKIVEHLSRGTTLQAGTCIMTGTPSGVGVFMVSLLLHLLECCLLTVRLGTERFC